MQQQHQKECYSWTTMGFGCGHVSDSIRLLFGNKRILAMKIFTLLRARHRLNLICPFLIVYTLFCCSPFSLVRVYTVPRKEKWQNEPAEGFITDCIYSIYILNCTVHTLLYVCRCPGIPVQLQSHIFKLVIKVNNGIKVSNFKNVSV